MSDKKPEPITPEPPTSAPKKKTPWIPPDLRGIVVTVPTGDGGAMNYEKSKQTYKLGLARVLKPGRIFGIELKTGDLISLPRNYIVFDVYDQGDGAGLEFVRDERAEKAAALIAEAEALSKPAPRQRDVQTNEATQADANFVLGRTAARR